MLCLQSVTLMTNALISAVSYYVESHAVTSQELMFLFSCVNLILVLFFCKARYS